MPLGDYEDLLGKTSSMSSSIADCIEMDEYLDCDDYTEGIIEETIKGITELQSIRKKDYSMILTALEIFKKEYLAGKNECESMEVDYPDLEVFQNAYMIVRDYYDEVVEKRLEADSN